MSKKEEKNDGKVTKEEKGQETKAGDATPPDPPADEKNDPPKFKNAAEEAAWIHKHGGVFGQKGTLPNTHERSFLTKGVKGRDGSGPCRVLGLYKPQKHRKLDPKTKRPVTYEKQVLVGGKVMMPSGHIAIPGDTFDPVAEGMSLKAYQRLVLKKYISANEQVEKELGDAGAKES